MRLFQRLRTKTRQATPAFEDLVLTVLAERFGSSGFTRTDEPLVISFNGNRFGLQSLHAIYTRDALAHTELRDLIIQRFERLLGEMGSDGGPAPLHWNDASARLHPQFMPSEFLKQAPAPLAHRPFNNDISIGIVVDRENTYSYVRVDDLPLWGKSFDEVFATALSNLDRASAGVEMHVSEGEDAFVAVEAGDGYDAARILVPGLRAVFAEHLGEPFFVGVPNRDFLICWSQSASESFHRSARAKIADDFSRQPYPLTGDIFVATSQTITPERRLTSR